MDIYDIKNIENPKIRRATLIAAGVVLHLVLFVTCGVELLINVSVSTYEVMKKFVTEAKPKYMDLLESLRSMW